MRASWLLGLFFLFSLQPVWAGKKKFDLAPKYHLNATPPSRIEAGLPYELVEKGGMFYMKFSGENGDLYVLHGQPLTANFITSAQCFGLHRESEKDPGRAALLMGDVKLPESELRAFAGLIQQTTKDRCGNPTLAEVKPPSLDVGISKTVKGKDGIKREFRLFNTNLQPNLNFSGQF